MNNRRIPLALLLVLTLLATVLSVAAGGGVAFADDGHNHTINTQKTDCKLEVPAFAFTPKGLATPWKLSSGAIKCREANPNTSVFVQATIFSPSTKQFFIYSPLVIDKGTRSAIAPVVPKLPADAVVGIWGGGNDNTTKLVGHDDQCINGFMTVFGQVFFCGAARFFKAVKKAHVVPPPLGTANDGLPCPTVRDFSIVDQDQSDNVQTTYIANPAGMIAQDTAANEALMKTYITLSNGSDNALLTKLVLPALGCKPWTAPDLANGGAPALSQALDEIQAAAYQASPQALVPPTDPMVLVNGKESLMKLDLYRAGVDQPLVYNLRAASPMQYCLNVMAAVKRVVANAQVYAQYPTAVASVANNLWTFLAARLDTTLSSPVGQGGLGCTGAGNVIGGLLHRPSPVQLTLDINGVAISATISL